MSSHYQQQQQQQRQHQRQHQRRIATEAAQAQRAVKRSEASLDRVKKEVGDLARAARRKAGDAVERVSNSSVTQAILSNIAVVLLVFAVVVVALAVWMGYDAVALGSSTGWPDFALVGLANALLVGIGVAAGAYCAYLCVRCSRDAPFKGLGFLGSLAAPVMFMLACVLMLVAFYFFFFHGGDVRAAFWVMVASLVPAVLLMLMAWKCSSRNAYSALWASLPFVIVLGVITWLFWRTYDYVSSSV